MLLGEVPQRLGGADGILPHERQRHRAGEVLTDPFHAGGIGGETRQGHLDDPVVGARLTEAAPELLHLPDVQTAVFGQKDRFGLFESFLDVLDCPDLLRSWHSLLLTCRELLGTRPGALGSDLRWPDESVSALAPAVSGRGSRSCGPYRTGGRRTGQDGKEEGVSGSGSGSGSAARSTVFGRSHSLRRQGRGCRPFRAPSARRTGCSGCPWAGAVRRPAQSSFQRPPVLRTTIAPSAPRVQGKTGRTAGFCQRARAATSSSLPTSTWTPGPIVEETVRDRT